MIANMGAADRAVRVVVGTVALVVSIFFCWGSVLGTVVGIALLGLAGLMFVTAAIGFCPTYRLLRISTNPTLHRTLTSETRAHAHA